MHASSTIPTDMALRTYTIAVSATLSAPAEACYTTIADYRKGHPAILPPEYFGPLTVETGGVGDGTKIRFAMRVLGQERLMHAAITEPVPGRVLVETYLDTGVVTTFTVVAENGGQSRVTLETRSPRLGGVRAAMERAVTKWILPRIYGAELGRLAAQLGGSIVGRPDVVRAG
jgi:hypothetical protein